MPRYTADVVHLSACAGDDDRFCTVPFEGADEHAAARLVADMAARRRYGDDAESSFLQRMNPCQFTAAIGNYQRRGGYGRVAGVTILIRLQEAV